MRSATSWQPAWLLSALFHSSYCKGCLNVIWEGALCRTSSSYCTCRFHLLASVSPFLHTQVHSTCSAPVPNSRCEKHRYWNKACVFTYYYAPTSSYLRVLKLVPPQKVPPKTAGQSSQASIIMARTTDLQREQIGFWYKRARLPAVLSRYFLLHLSAVHAELCQEYTAFMGTVCCFSVKSPGMSSSAEGPCR